jgi:hypothetical protein
MKNVITTITIASRGGPDFSAGGADGADFAGAAGDFERIDPDRSAMFLRWVAPRSLTLRSGRD